MEDKVNELIQNPFKPHEEQLKIFSNKGETVASVKPVFGRK